MKAIPWIAPLAVLSLVSAALAQAQTPVNQTTLAGGKTAEAPSADLPSVALENGGFEGDVRPLGANPNQKGQVSGQIGAGWEDNSGWAGVTVDYGLDATQPHGGKSAQRIDVKEIHSGAVQFVQTRSLQKNHVYHAEVWLRSAVAQNIEVAFREEGAPYKTYASRLVAVDENWQKISLGTTMTEDAPTYFMIHPAGPGTLWVDDALLQDMTTATSTSPPRLGNLLADGSFEAGFGAGWSLRLRGVSTPATAAAHEFEGARYTIDHATATDGATSLKTVIAPGMGAYLYSPPSEFNFGRVHTASVDLKADREDVAVELALDGSPVTKNVRAGKTWQRFTVSGTLPYSQSLRTDLKIICFSGGVSTTLWVDGAELREGAVAAPAYTPAYPVELALATGRPGSVFFDGETAVLQVTSAGAVAGAHLRCTVTDLYGTARTLPDVPLPLATIVVPEDAARPRGMFKVRAQVVGKAGEPLSPAVDQVFARLPHPREIAPEDSYFGVHIPLTPAYFAISRAVGARWARLHDASVATKWPAIQPQPGAWQFVDDGARGARAAGMQVLGMFDGAPLWTTLHPEATSGYWATYNVPDAPGGKEQWADYVQRTAAHYKGIIDYWEVWNEPWGHGNFAGTPEQYGELLKLAYQSAKAGNPGATIVGIDAADFRPAFTAGALSVAGTSSFDAFSFHKYSSALYGGPTGFAIQTVADFRGAQAKVGEVKPLWMTEGGGEKLASWYGDNSDGMTPRDQLAYIVRFDVTQMAAGVRHFFYYSLHADPQFGEAGYCALEHDRSIRPLLAARAVLASLVDGVPCQGRNEPVTGVDAYTFGPDHGKTVTVVWSYLGKSHLVPVPVGAHVLDVQGNAVAAGANVEVTSEPVYFIR